MRRAMIQGWTVGVLTGCLLLTAAALAQPPGGGPGGPGGGPGGGFFGGGFGGGPLEMLRRQDVRKELELLDDQVSELQKFEESVREKMRTAFSGMQDVPREERMEKAREAFEKIRQEGEAKVKEVLLPHQQKRLEQLSNQFRVRGGAGRALSGDRLAEELSLSDEQKEKIRAKAEQLGEQMRQKIAELQKQSQEELLKELTPAQQQKWKEMMGDPFEFQRDEPGQFGPQGRGGFGQGGAPGQGRGGFGGRGGAPAGGGPGGQTRGRPDSN